MSNLMNTGQVAEMLGVSRGTIRNMIEANTFVTPVPISNRRIAFVRDDVESWIETRKASWSDRKLRERAEREIEEARAQMDER